ncbi:YhgE/Pip domain-containing protein [Paenibacillus sp. NPDC058174]|uniref:YhgE/Pip domain-containing protein n=1 Tax=Paenibacillus sp. NPDC058174 TaxID=3346366 RepID=UPI0036DB831B
MRTILAFLKSKTLLGGAFMLVFYQIIFVGIFISGYSAVPKNAADLTVAIVNEDAQYGAEIAKQIQEQLPFHLKTNLSYEEAKEELNGRDVHLVVHIPNDFTQKLTQQGEQVQLDFLINQSNPQLVSGTMQSVASQITDKLSQQLTVENVKGILQGLKLPEDQASQLADQASNKFKSNMVLSNPQPAGMHNQMAPMFVTMVSYVGAMIYSMMAVSTLGQLRSKFGKWKAFLGWQGANALISLIAPLIGLTIYFSVQGYGAEVFVQMWLSHALEMFVAMEVTSVFCLLLGQAGMIVNLPLLLIQTISGGSVMTQEMMPGFFKFFSSFSVMYYSTQTDYNLLFGGSGTWKSIMMMAVIGLGALVINSVIHQFKKVNESKDSIPQPLMM